MTTRRESTADAAQVQKTELKQKKKETTAAIEGLRAEINELIVKAKTASPFAADGPTNGGKTRKRRTLAGHFSKVVSVTWHSDSQRAMTSSQDGNVIIWDTFKQVKKFLVPLSSAWVMFAENSKGESNEQFMSGGLDNIMTLWKVPVSAEPGRAIKEFHGHDGYVCSGRFIDGGKMLTISGDRTIGKWDVNMKIEQGQEDMREQSFSGHDKDVTSIDLKPGSMSEFITSSADGSVLLWDLNAKKSTGAMRLAFPSGYDGATDVNKAKYQANGYGVGMSTEANGCFLYDTRCLNAVNTFDPTGGSSKASAKYSCSFSLSGRLLFVGCEDNSVEVWDTTAPDSKKPVKVFNDAFTNRVADVAVAPNGTGCAAVSWDTNGAIFSQ